MSWQPSAAWIFCPANRPDRYEKALAIADVVVCDLEDAVALDQKQRSRVLIQDLVDRGRFDFERTVVRINGARSPEHQLDVAAVRAAGLTRIMVAKCEGPGDLVRTAGSDVIALVETPRGVTRCEEIASDPSVVGLMWGADDLVASMGGFSSRLLDGRYRDFARYARSKMLLAAKAESILAIDAVHMDIADLRGLRDTCDDAVAAGFDATVAIHPSQVEVIRAAYAPSADRVAWADRLLRSVDSSGGVTTFEGRMVDGPVYAQARRILRLAGVSNPH